MAISRPDLSKFVILALAVLAFLNLCFILWDANKDLSLVGIGNSASMKQHFLSNMQEAEQERLTMKKRMEERRKKYHLDKSDERVKSRIDLSKKQAQKEMDKPQEQTGNKLDKAAEKAVTDVYQRKEQAAESMKHQPATTKTEGKQQDNAQKISHTLASLSCSSYGGPSDEVAQDMVYWQDIPSDDAFASPFKVPGETKYLTFEPDSGGWNNLRMAMETVIALSHAMGRTLVLPPEQNIYLFNKERDPKKNVVQTFSFKNFYHYDTIHAEHNGIDIITTEEFLLRMHGKLKNRTSGEVLLPPGNRTNWNGIVFKERKPLKMYLRAVAPTPQCGVTNCFFAFPTKGEDETLLRQMFDEVRREPNQKRYRAYTDHPAPVDSSPPERLREMVADRKELLFYDKKMQNERVLHFQGDGELRHLVHFYAFLFFQDWRQDLWTKRFIRDHVRYIDEIQCAAARVVEAMKLKAKENTGYPFFDTMHIRRGDFQYKTTRIEAEEILKNTEDLFHPNGTLFIATDEMDRSFFEPIMKQYHTFFLSDFSYLIKDVNKNYYGMLDQLIASRGKAFVGAYYSTFTGFITRMRGYHVSTKKLPGYEEGIQESYYYAPRSEKLNLKHYQPLTPPLWMKDFPVSWRDIDKGIGELGS